MKKTILELKEERIGYQEELNILISNAETEKREMNEQENNRMAELRSLMDKVDEQIKAQEAENQQLASKCNNKTKTKKRMKLTTLINKVIEGRVNAVLDRDSLTEKNVMYYSTGANLEGEKDA